MPTPGRGTLALLTMVALVAGACSAREDDGLVGASPGSTPPGSVAPTKSPASGPAPIKAPKGWKVLSFQGISFAYPTPPGSVREASDGETGPRHAWSIRRSDRCDPRGNCRSYEFAAVNDGCPGTDPWPTYAHRFVQKGFDSFISTCAGKDSFAIEPLKIVTRADGLKGVIYDAGEWFGSADPGIEGALAAVLNFPKGFHRSYEALALYFEDPTPLETIEAALRLVTLDA